MAAAVFCFAGAALGFIGLIHAPKVGWNANGEVALGYAFFGIILLAFWFLRRGQEPEAIAEDVLALPEPRATEAPAAAGS